MDKIDARSLSEESLELLRRQARRLRREGRTWVDIAKLIGVHLTTVMKWSRRFNLDQPDTPGVPTELKSQRRGRRVGESRTISQADEATLRDDIVTTHPNDMGLPFALWNRKAVQEAIKLRFGIDMPIRTVGEYLKRWGFTPQRPVKRAVEQRPELLDAWHKVIYPAIVKRAKAEGGEVYWADETAIKQDTAWVRGYAPPSQTPVILHKARWNSITMISAITNQGLVRFSFHDGAINAERFIEFLEALIEDAQRKVFLIVDNLRVHHAKLVKAWLVGREKKIEIFYLPPYSPEANPDEILNRDLKTELRLRPSAPDVDALKKIARDFMDRLAGMPQRVVQYFKSRQVSYAASS